MAYHLEKQSPSNAGLAGPVLDDDIIVGGDDVVEAGHAKLAELGRMYNEDPVKAAQYRKMLAERGFDTSRFKRPVLIHRRLNAFTSEERAGFILSNRGDKSAGAGTFLYTAYGPMMVQLLAGRLPPPVKEALNSVAADWHRLRLAVKERGSPLAATPSLRAAAAAAEMAEVSGRPVATLILEGAMVDTGFTEAAFGFLRLMHEDAALSKLSDAESIARRLQGCILALEIEDTSASVAAANEASEVKLEGSASLAERASAAIAALASWKQRPHLDTAKLSATTDLDALRQVVAFNELPATKIMHAWLGRDLGVRNAAPAGVIAEFWLKGIVRVFEHLLVAPESAPELIDRIKTVMTEAFELEALAGLAAHRNTPFDDLTADLRSAFVRYGLDAGVWNRIRGMAEAGIVDLAKLDTADTARLSAMIEHSPKAVIGLDAQAFPVTAMASSLIERLPHERSGRFAPLFSAALTMISIAMFAMQLKRRMRREPALDLDDPRSWTSAYLQSGAGLLIGRLLARINCAVDGFAHHENSQALPGALAGFLLKSVTGSSVWYARRGADRLLWEEIQAARGRDFRAAYARMARRQQA